MANRHGYRICIIVDNPLRDLDGLLLVAWHLAQQGNIVFLVPIYEQGFDILALKPDIVVANYARSNNIELLRRFHNDGIFVAILDTEGSPGREMDGFAKMVSQTGIGKFAILYCLWGHEQHRAFTKVNTVPSAIMVITGCPRYDYCSPPLRRLLESPKTHRNYVLINTSFPIANPRFTTGAEEERKTMVGIGYSRSFANQYVQDIDLAYRKFKEIVKHVVEYFPDIHFVLRPHPFENCESYQQYIKFPNFEVRQEGSSIEWLNQAKLLIHLNCITAIEATMLGVEPVSVEWINTQILANQAPPLNVGHKAQTQDELLQVIRDIISGAFSPAEEALHARLRVIQERYHAIDGLSAKRVADAIQSALQVNSSHSKIDGTSYGFKQCLRERLGYSIFHKIRYFIEGSKNESRRKAKSLLISEVSAKLIKINSASNNNLINVSYVADQDLIRHKLFSRNTLKIYKTAESLGHESEA